MDEDSSKPDTGNYNERKIRNNKFSTMRVLLAPWIRFGILDGAGIDRFIRSYYIPVLCVVSSVFWALYLLA